MLAGALIFLVETAAGFFTIALLVRFLMQWARAPQHNPISHFVNALTNFAVRPARRVIPGLWGLDLATLVLAWLVQLIELVLVLTLRGYEFGPAAGQAVVAVVLLAAVMVLRFVIYIVMILVIVQAVMSWFSPDSPIAPLLSTLTRPFLRPFQRRIPPVGNVDLSPLILIVVLQLLLMLPVAYAQDVLTGLLVAR